MKNKSSRVFGASLKPAWNDEQIEHFLTKLTGSAIVYIINHDKDVNNETLKLIEEHTHIYIEYSTPRKISTVANLLNVQPNFIEIVRNKVGYMRYLTHMDDKDKHTYDVSEVYTNDTVSYKNKVLGSAMSDKEIAQYVKAGRALDLLGVVSGAKIRTIMSILHYDKSNQSYQLLKEMRQDMKDMSDQIQKSSDWALDLAKQFQENFKGQADGLVGGVQQLALELSRIAKLANRKLK